MKNGLLLYYDLKDVFSYLTDEEAGKMIKAVFDYEIDGALTDFEDRMMASTYKRITDHLDRNKKKYEEIRQQRRQAAFIRWEKEKDMMM